MHKLLTTKGKKANENILNNKAKTPKKLWRNRNAELYKKVTNTTTGTICAGVTSGLAGI